VAPPQVLWIVSGTSIYEGHETIRVCPEEGDHDERSLAQNLQGAAEVTRYVLSGEEKGEG